MSNSPGKGKSYSSTSHQALTRLKATGFHLQNCMVAGISHFCIEPLQRCPQAFTKKKKELFYEIKNVTTFRNSVEEPNCCTKKNNYTNPMYIFVCTFFLLASLTHCRQITLLAKQSCIPWKEMCWLVWERMHWAIKRAVCQADVSHSHHGWFCGEQYIKVFWCLLVLCGLAELKHQPNIYKY